MLKIRSIRFLVLRRTLQIGIIALFVAANYLGWQVLKGNYSSTLLLNKVHLSDPFASLQLLLTGMWLTTSIVLGALAMLVLYGLFFGRAFCSWICPVNVVNDFAKVIGKKIPKNKTMSSVITRNVRYWILALALVLSVILQIPAFEAVSPIGLFYRAIIFGAVSSWAILVAFFLLELAFVKNFWCGRICPLGAFYAVVGKFRLLRIKHKVENCTNCNKCFEICPEVQVMEIVKVKSGTINNSECTNCGRCIEVCNDKALKFGIKDFKKHRA